MKTKIKQNTKAIILGLIVTLGMGYAGAQTFSGPTCSPTSTPGCNTPAPINASSTAQIKTGPLTLMHLFTPDFTLTNSNGTVTGIPDGSILVADGANTGKVKWQQIDTAEAKQTYTLTNATKTAGNGISIALRIDATTLCGDSNGCTISARDSAGTQILPDVKISHEGMYPNYNSVDGTWITWTRTFNNYMTTCNAGIATNCSSAGLASYDSSGYYWYVYNYNPITAAANSGESNPFVFWISVPVDTTNYILVEDFRH